MVVGLVRGRGARGGRGPGKRGIEPTEDAASAIFGGCGEVGVVRTGTMTVKGALMRGVLMGWGACFEGIDSSKMILARRTMMMEVRTDGSCPFGARTWS